MTPRNDKKFIERITKAIVFIEATCKDIILGVRPFDTPRRITHMTRWIYAKPNKKLGPYIILNASIERPTEQYDSTRISLECIDNCGEHIIIWWKTPSYETSVYVDTTLTTVIIEQNVKIYTFESDGSLEHIKYKCSVTSPKHLKKS
jgi:hypothetical protein